MRQRTRRGDNELREIAITPGYLDFADGSCLITWGRTRVICAATVSEQVPPFPDFFRGRLGHRGVRHAAPGHPYPDVSGSP